MGTPDFAVKSAESILKAGHEIAAVFTRQDKPRNRGKQISATPVKEFAAEHGIPVIQPKSLKSGEDAENALLRLHEINPDVIVVVAYGQILPKSVLELPRLGCVNVHASLLPKYRGAAPIQRCIENGETRSGVCTMRMDEGLDTGDVIERCEVEVPDDMTGSELWDLLAEKGGELIVSTLKKLADGTATFTKQPEESPVGYAKTISKEELHLDFGKPAEALYNFIRAMADTPCAYTVLEGKRMKVYRARISEKRSVLPAGSIADTKRFAVVCGDGNCIEFTEIQPEGGKRMSAEAYLRGKKLTEGIILE